MAMNMIRDLKARARVAISSRLPTPEGNDTPSIQLIDGNGNFKVNDLNEFSKMVNLSSCELSYAVVSIIGQQSSGKSTLVNHLFGTTFKEMDAIKGRSQTTKGIWLSKAADIEPFTIVIDVEGRDGMERGESVHFEKQSALFALAVSDVVLVNMWCHDVGLEIAGGRPLLKIVLEKILNLSEPRKITLMFVLRDATETPLDSLEETLMTSVREIYASVYKPDRYKSAPLDHFFNVIVITLASYQHNTEEFKKQVGVLKKAFMDSTGSDGLVGVQKDKVLSSMIPSSFPEIWKTIKEDKDLDLPKHKVMLATVRCDEIIKERLSKFYANQDWLHLEKSLKSGPVPEFGKTINSIINTYLTEFDAKVVYFDESVTAPKRQQLLEKMLQHVQRAADKMLEHLGNKAVETYKEKFDKADRTNAQAAQDCNAYSLSILEMGVSEMGNEYISWDASKVFDTVQEKISIYTMFSHYKAALDQALADRDEAVALAAAARTDAEKAASEVKTATAKAAASEEAAAKAIADSKAADEAREISAKVDAEKAREIAAQAAAEKAAAIIRAEAAERASAAAREAVERAEKEAITKKNSLTEWLKTVVMQGFVSVLDFFGINWRM